MYTNQPINQFDPVSQGIFGGVDNVFAPYMGPQTAALETDPTQKRHRAKWTLADGKAASSEYLGDTALDLLFTSFQTWHTEVILPWRGTDEINFNWTKFEYNAHLMRDTPALAPSRLITQRKYSRSASLVRKGIAFEYEHDFVRSGEGRTSFVAALAQIARATQETANAEVIRALMHADMADDNYKKQNEVITDKTIREYIENDRERFAIAQKSEHGLPKLSVDINNELDQYNGMADTFIMPQVMSDYLEFRPESTEYYRQGQPKTLTVQAPHPLDNPLPTRFVREAPVYMTRSKHIEGVGQSDPLGQLRQNGSYNTMRLGEHCDFENYNSCSRDRQIYDEDADDWKTVTLEHALDNCGLFDKNGDLLLPNVGDNWRGRVDSEAMDRDFLLFQKGGQNKPRSAIEYIGDMDLDHLDTKTVLNAAKAMRSELMRMMTKDGYASLAGDLPSAQGVVPGFDNLGDAARNAINRLADGLRSIVGVENAFFAGEGSIAERVYNSLYLQNMVPVTGGSRSFSDEQFEQYEDLGNKLLNSLAVVAPEEKKDEIEEIKANPKGLDVLAVARAIRNKIKEYKRANLEGPHMDKFGTLKDIDEWYKVRAKKYEKELAEAKKASADSGDDTIMWAPAGQDLSGKDYSYVYQSSADHISSPIASIPTFRVEMDKKRSARSASSGGSRRVVDDGAGMGFAGIGRQHIGDRAQRRRENAEGFDFDVRFRALGHQIKGVNDRSESRLDRMLALAFLGTRFTRDHLKTLARKNVPVPLDFILARPHQQRHTQAIIKCARGGRSGYTFFAYPGMEIGHNAGTKYSHAHFTMHIRAIVQHPENVYVQRDAYVDGYLGGNGTSFYDRETYMKIDWDDIDHSIVCIAIPVTEKRIGDKNGTLDLKGHFGMDYIKDMGQAVGTVDKDGPHYSTYYRYNQIYGFDKQMRRGAPRADYTSTKRHLNLICEPASQRSYNPITGEWSRPTANRDHWGPNIVGPGCADIRAGKKRYMSDMNFIAAK